MKKLFFIMYCCLFSGIIFSQQTAKPMNNNFAIVLHGGAGTILKENMSPELEKQYRSKLAEALQAGYDTLSHGGTSVDAVVEAIKILEDSPLFNAGKGSVFTNDGKNEMDAAIMNGRTLKAGAVAGVRKIKNPIMAALCVMERSQHVLMVGPGAEKFAKVCKCDTATAEYFFEQQRWDQLQKIKKTDKAELDHGNKIEAEKGHIILPQENQAYPDQKFGTVGVAALDQFGNIAAGTSTGGMTNKKYGRVGDSPIIGAGTYANNKTCAVSCTGYGEYFMRSVVAYDISALMEYKGLSLQEACNEVVYKKLIDVGGEGGLIAIDAQGNIAMPFNSAGMYRGYMKSNGEKDVLIYK
jgi:beta-aspartyl-peptidase (threonine type)